MLFRSAEDVFFYLESLKDVGYAIVFVSTVLLDQKDLNKLKVITSTIIIRKNYGADFGSFKEGLMFIKKHSAKLSSITIANDSVIGPIHPLKKVYQEMQNQKCDFWGITESSIGSAATYHLCSYFLVFNKDVLSSKVFWDFWQTYPCYTKRSNIIKKGEVAMTTTLISAGFYCKAYVSGATLLKNFFSLEKTMLARCLKDENQYYKDCIVIINLLSSYNHQQFYALALLKYGIPFIKKDLIKRFLITKGELDAYLEVTTKLNKNKIVCDLVSQAMNVNFRDRLLMIGGRR